MRLDIFRDLHTTGLDHLWVITRFPATIRAFANKPVATVLPTLVSMPETNNTFPFILLFLYHYTYHSYLFLP